jgi:hypothetical protein
VFPKRCSWWVVLISNKNLDLVSVQWAPSKRGQPAMERSRSDISRKEKGPASNPKILTYHSHIHSDK